jgi:shikimate dehydrogenase
MISGRTTLFAVIGSPVDHSLSPAMQNAAFAAAAFDGAYVALPVAPDELEAAIRGARALGFGGLNVTGPHKEAVVPFCAALDDVAAQVGAVNVLARHARGWAGFNTDAPAVRGLLTDAGIGPRSRALVLGAGGAARAAVWALVAMGANVMVSARRGEAAEALASGMVRSLELPENGIRTVDWEAVAPEAIQSDAIVNATTVGLSHHAGDLPALAWRSGQVALDFVYGETAFARSARGNGARLVTGEQVLVRQGALAFKIWLGRAANEDVMARAIERHGGR